MNAIDDQVEEYPNDDRKDHLSTFFASYELNLDGEDASDSSSIHRKDTMLIRNTRSFEPIQKVNSFLDQGEQDAEEGPELALVVCCCGFGRRAAGLGGRLQSDHHGHFLLVRGVHSGAADIEFVNQLTTVLENEANGFTGFDLNLFRLEISVDQVDLNRPGYFRSVARAAKFKVAVTALVAAGGKSNCRGQRYGQGNNGKSEDRELVHRI